MMNSLSSNPFNIDKPQTYFCTIWRYLASHSILLIRVDKDKPENDESFYLYFELVQFFEGPFRWSGANFYIGPSDECLKLLQKVGFKGIPDDYLLERFSVFKVELPNSETVKILAASTATKTNEIPPELLD